MIWAYAIVDAGRAPLPRVPGLDGAPLSLVHVGDACAVVSRHDDASPPEWSREALLGHEAVVEALMSTRAVLPLRFGTTQPDEVALVRALEQEHRDWPALLERVRGRVELAVTVPAVDDGGPEQQAPGDGRRYLLDKVARHRAAVDAARRLDQAMAPISEAVNTRIQPGDDVALKAAYLVRRTHAADARRRIESAGVGAICTGPWPPYSFTSAERLERMSA